MSIVLSEVTLAFNPMLGKEQKNLCLCIYLMISHVFNRKDRERVKPNHNMRVYSKQCEDSEPCIFLLQRNGVNKIA